MLVLTNAIIAEFTIITLSYRRTPRLTVNIHTITQTLTATPQKYAVKQEQK